LTRPRVGRGGTGGRGLSGERFLDALAERDAASKETGPLGGDLLVDAVEEPDEESLERGEDCEEDLEDGDDVGVGDEEHQVAKDPRETNGNVDRDVDSELLLSVALVGLGGSGEGLVDLSTDEEEEDTVGGDDDETGDEEAEEAEEVAGDPTLGIVGTGADRAVGLGGSRDDDEDGGEAPGEKVVPLLEKLGLAISSHDHLVEVERDTEGPTKVGYEEKVHHDGDEDATPFVRGYGVLVRSDEHGVPYNDTNA